MNVALLAQQAADDFYLRTFGVLADYSPASLLGLDGFCDELWGTAGELSRNPGWTPRPGQVHQILRFGSYAGEVIRRTFGGVWRVDAKDWYLSTVALAGGLNLLPLAKIVRRMRDGADQSVFALYWAARTTMKPAIPMDEPAMYRRHAEHVRANAPAHLVAPLAERLLACAALPPGQPPPWVKIAIAAGPPETRPGAASPPPVAPVSSPGPAPGTLLADCPLCKRHGQGRKACLYCGASLVQPAVCGRCERKNPPTARACQWCRAPL